MDFKLLYSLYQSTKYKSKAIVFSSDMRRQSGHSPAMKQTKHIHGVNNLVEEINNVESKQECQTMKYDIQFIFCSCKITEIERKCIMRKHRKRYYV